MDSPVRRLFIALPVDDGRAVHSLTDVSSNLKNYESLLKTVPAGNYHITLKFFGSVDPEVSGSITNSFLTLGQLKKVEFRIKGIGAFPSADQPSVIWAGLKCNEQPLDEIFQSVEMLAETLGFPREKRKFIPHLTLARVRREKNIPQELKDYLVKEKNSLFASSVFTELVLFESILKNTGAEYKRIAAVKLI